MKIQRNIAPILLALSGALALYARSRQVSWRGSGALRRLLRGQDVDEEILATVD